MRVMTISALRALSCVGLAVLVAECAPTSRQDTRLDPDAFTASMAARLNQSEPRQVRVAARLMLESRAANGTSISIDLHRTYQACTTDPPKCPTYIEHLVLGARDLAGTALNVLVPTALRAVLRPVGYVKDNPGIAPAMTRVSTPDAPEGLVALIYADAPNTMRTVSARDLAAMHLDASAAYDFALRNMAMELPALDAAVRQLPPRRVGVLEGSAYESSRLLMHADWAALSVGCKGHLLVAAPAAATVLFTDGSVPGGLAAIAAQAREEFDKAERGISPDVFEWRQAGWERVMR